MNENNIIFLDIDGVLNDNTSSYSAKSINVLKEIINKYRAKLVLITSEQRNGTVEQRNKIIIKLKQLGLDVCDFIDPNFEGDIIDIKIPSRVLGIIHYLNNNPVDKYLILDDDYYNDYKLLSLNYYRTRMFKGLLEKDLAKIEFRPVNLNNFKYVNYRYRQLGEYEFLTNEIVKVLKKIYQKKNN